MDYSKLLDESEFNQDKLKLLETVVQVFYKTTNNNDRATANQILNSFKQLNNAYQYCDNILTNSSCIHTKIFGLTILEDLVKTKFNLLKNGEKEIIRNFLVDILIKSVSSGINDNLTNNFVNKLNLIIVHIAKSEWPTTWNTFMSEICNASKSSQELCENNLKLLIAFSEEINEFWRNSLTRNKAKVLQNMMNQENHLLYDLCMFILNNSNDVKKSLLKYALRLFAESVKYFPLDKVFDDNLLSKFLNDMTKISAVRVDIMKCFNEIFNIPIEIDKYGEDNYYKYKNLIIQLFKSYILHMMSIANNIDFSKEYYKIKSNQVYNYEDFILQFSNSIFSFFKYHFSFIQEFDCVQGEVIKESEFVSIYMNEIHKGLVYMTQFMKINNDEILKLTSEFFLWFSYKVCFLINKSADPNNGAPLDNTIEFYISLTNQSLFYNKYYRNVLEDVRLILIKNMVRPTEVKIDVNEDGDIVVEQLHGTIYATLHETMRDTIIFLTHLDPVSTQQIMINTLHENTYNETINVNSLNSVCWAIGCISGALPKMQEKKFLVVIIRYLLTFCEKVEKKTHKAIVASNIMYVVGQYYGFLNTHWKFLKTVVNKLFEFMHELHPGVQDFACETFLKISVKCGYQFTIINEQENEPYIDVLARLIDENTADLKSHQMLMFYEAIGNMIAFENNNEKQLYLITASLNSPQNQIKSIFESASKDSNILLEQLSIKVFDLTLKLNERMCNAIKTPYFNYGINLINEVVNAYVFYSNTGNAIYNNEMNGSTNSLKNIRKTILKYITSVIVNTENPQLLINNLLPLLTPLIEQYNKSHLENRDAETLIVFTEIINKLKNIQYDYINSIWNYLCIFTLKMIQQDYQSFPEHRLNFFNLVKALILNAFDSLFKIQESSFNNDVLNAIIWAFRHSQLNISETGLETLMILLDVSLL